MGIYEKIEFLKKYVLSRNFSKQANLLLKNEGYFIASECARQLGFSKQYFSQCPSKHSNEYVIFEAKKYYKLK